MLPGARNEGTNTSNRIANAVTESAPSATAAGVPIQVATIAAGNPPAA